MNLRKKHESNTIMCMVGYWLFGMNA